ncbi:MAG: metal ABC transporter ATP-binding protein [Planctomycetota bacterium]
MSDNRLAPADCSAVCMQGISFAYDGAPVLEDVDLSIGRGDMVCIVGPNGGGKTTLLRLMLGLLRPRTGRVQLFGASPEKARLKIGYMPQQSRFDPQFPVNVLDVVLMGRLGQQGWPGRLGWYTRADREAAIQSLREVGMQAFAARPMSALSGGQRQRALIARAIVSEPQLLILDEPTANVDSAGESQLLQLLRELHRRMTILMVSHDVGFVSHLVQKVVCVNRTVAVHPAVELTAEAIERLYGGQVRHVHHGDVLPHGEHKHG